MTGTAKDGNTAIPYTGPFASAKSENQAAPFPLAPGGLGSLGMAIDVANRLTSRLNILEGKVQRETVRVVA